jgi:4-amino-4-deoxy-L-arabinose transferase-like glycosyltransferase
VLVAIGLRGIDLGSFPAIMAEDEGYFAWGATQIGPNLNPFAYDIHHHPYFFHLLQRVSIEALGQTVSAARLPAAFLGTLMILAVYLGGRVWFDRRIAWLAALSLLAAPTQWHFSRLALNQPFDPAFGILGLALLGRGLPQGERPCLAMAGLCLGLSQYGYSASRLIPLLAAFYALAVLLTHRADWRNLLGRVSIAAGVALVVVLPQAYFLYQNPFEGLSPRLRDVSLFSEQARQRDGDLVGEVDWPDQIQAALLGFVARRDASIFYGPYDPFLGWLGGIVALVGLGVALRGWREPRYSLLVVWWAGTALLGGILLTNPPEFQRYVVAWPALALLIGLGLQQMSGGILWLSERLTPEQPIPPLVERWLLPLGLVTVLGVVNLYSYGLEYRRASPYFDLPRIVHLNHLADTVYPDLVGYEQVWYLPAANLNLTTSPILRYKAPYIEGVEYLGSAESFPFQLAQGQGRQAVILALGHPLFEAFYSTLEALPEAERLILLNPRTQQPYAVVFRFAVPPLPR